MDIDFAPDEEIPLLKEDESSMYEDADTGETEETSFWDDIPTDDPGFQMRDKDRQINALERNFNVEIPREQRARFRLNSGYLQVENDGKFINLTKSNGEFLASSTLRTRLGASLARNLLGIETPKSVKIRSRILLDEIPTEIEMDDLAPNKIEEVIDKTKEIAVNTDLDMREFLGIDKALTRIKGELENNASKLTELDEHLERERGKLAEVKDDESVSDETRQRI
jgi:hypothetical protein